MIPITLQQTLSPFPSLRLRFVGGLMLLLGGIFFIAALEKAVAPNSTIVALTYLIGSRRAMWLIWWLVFGEILLAAALMGRLAPRVTLSLTATTLVAFLVWIFYLKISHAPIDCGCGLKLPSWLPLVTESGGAHNAALVRTGSLFLICMLALMLSFMRGGALRQSPI